MQVKSNSQQSNNCNAATPKLNANMKTAKKLENEKKLNRYAKYDVNPGCARVKRNFN